MLITEDEKGMDQKVLAVPNHKIENTFEQIKDIDDVNENMLNMIKNFYENYKSNEKGKWVKVSDFQSKEKTIEFIKKSTL
jgi:inorganic pyrophosphatase